MVTEMQEVIEEIVSGITEILIMDKEIMVDIIEVMQKKKAVE